MRFVHRERVDCTHVGKRVTIRWRTPDETSTDTVGVLTACDSTAFEVLNRRGETVTIARGLVVASRVVGE